MTARESPGGADDGAAGAASGARVGGGGGGEAVVGAGASALRCMVGVPAPKKIPSTIGAMATSASDSRDKIFAAGGRSRVERQANR